MVICVGRSFFIKKQIRFFKRNADRRCRNLWQIFYSSFVGDMDRIGSKNLEKAMDSYPKVSKFLCSSVRVFRSFEKVV